MEDKKIQIDKRLGETLSLTLKIMPNLNNDQVGIMIYSIDPQICCIDLWFFNNECNKNYLTINKSSYFNAEYLIQCYNLWTIVDLWSWIAPIYEMDLDELEKYDPEWVKKYLRKNVFDRLRND